jgi:hypothetical protein
MADLSKWDDEYKEMVLEYLADLDKNVLVDLVVAMMRDTEVDDMIDSIEEARRDF